MAELRADLLHYTCDSFVEHLETLDHYTDLAAKEMAARGVKAGWGRMLLDPPWTFVKTYVVKLGFLDGYRGLVISYAAAFYVYLKYAKARALDANQ